MCKPTTEDKRLLAAETFFHSYQTSREINHSIIRFDLPVNFTEIKIISPSQFLSTEKGGFIIGATDPSKFHVQFFCNNVLCPNVRSYERLGSINYDENSCSRILCSNNIWADKLIVRGKFLAITIVVYGTPKDPSVDLVQKKDQTTNLPLFELPGGMPNNLSVSNDFYLDPVFANEFSNLELDPNYY